MDVSVRTLGRLVTAILLPMGFLGGIVVVDPFLIHFDWWPRSLSSICHSSAGRWWPEIRSVLTKKKGPRNEKKAVPKEIQQQQQQQQQKGTKTREFQPKSVRLIAARYFDAAPADEFTGEPGGGWGWVGGGWVATGVATASRVVCPLATSPHQQCPGANRWRQSITEQRVSTPTTPNPHPLALSPNGAHIHETVGPDFDWPR